MSTSIAVDLDIDRRHVVPALLAIALAEQVDEPLVKAIRETEQSREPVPETWLAGLIGEFSAAGRRLDSAMIGNLNKLLIFQLHEDTPGAIRKALTSGPSWSPGRTRPARIQLTQGQVDELIALVRSHYRVMIRAGGAPGGFALDAAAERRWKALGILRPDVDLIGKVGDAFVAGRMAQILDDGMSVADMRRMAKEFPISREAALAMQAVQDRVAFDLSGGVGYRAEMQAGRLVLGRNDDAVRQIVAAYRAGTLKRTPTNRRGLSPDEIDAVAGSKPIEGWRQLGRELRNRMADEDRDRDWERVAASSLRMSANIGAIDAMAERGVRELWYDVHPRACEHCQRLYLEADGTPRIFTVGEIMENISTTGGANYGRKASKIGTAEGWLPGGLAHPWCMCRPKERIRGVAPQGRIQAAEASKPS